MKVLASWDQMHHPLPPSKEEEVHRLHQKPPVKAKLRCLVSSHRTQHLTCRLAEERVALLKDLGFVWYADPGQPGSDAPRPGSLRGRRQAPHGARRRAHQPKAEAFEKARWEDMYAALVAFKEQHKHCRVPTGCPDNPKLGQWVNTQRTLHRKGKLSDERMALLEAIGFVWDARAAR
mmetsp:Transcript_12640/g.35536  ORF Transcript_12640/g.35536 Transcript_12640/m.35536 type:complete len:177 (+) Transcript_12640:863-1393(+)